MAGNEEIIEQVSQYTVSKTISKCLRSLNGGGIRIDIENQPFLKLTINQENINVLNLEFGEKFMEMLLAAAMEMVSGNMRKE
ncbi:MAG: hypothetical protein WBL44_01185 [Nitrososphaeraceae archaeon]|jgi:hypothetical protein